jgi:ribosomal protein S18 acetylase RimI-like enzyme
VKIQIRDAIQTDVEDLIALSRENISKIYATFLGIETVDSYLQSGAVEQYLEENLSTCLVLVGDDSIVGYSVPKRDLIDLMMVDARYHRRGLGTVLLRHMEDTLFQTYRSLKLESFEANLAANSFYRKNGWAEVRTFTDEPSGIDKIEFNKSRPT